MRSCGQSAERRLFQKVPGRSPIAAGVSRCVRSSRTCRLRWQAEETMLRLVYISDSGKKGPWVPLWGCHSGVWWTGVGRSCVFSPAHPVCPTRLSCTSFGGNSGDAWSGAAVQVISCFCAENLPSDTRQQSPHLARSCSQHFFRAKTPPHQVWLITFPRRGSW